MPRINNNKGFTLVELVIAVLVIGLVSLVMSPAFQFSTMAMQNAYVEKQKLINKRIGLGLLSYAKEHRDFGNYVPGTLPGTYTGASYARTVYDPSDTTIANFITNEDVELAEINDDGSPGRKERVVTITAGTQNVPLFGSAGEEVTLNFQTITIYTSTCDLTDGTCDPTDAANDNDGATTVTFSTLPLQKAMLNQTAASIRLISKQMNTWYRTQLLAATPGATDNFYPDPNVDVDSGFAALSTENPTAAGQEGCNHQWFSMAEENGTPAVSIPAALGLDMNSVSRTPWEGLVEYCADYDPAAAANTEGVEPHFAAIRVNSAVTTGADPTGTGDIIIPI